MIELGFDEKEQKLYMDAGKVFMRYGIRSVTMDDIARHLRVSKKTLYLYVKDKSDLVQKFLALDCNVTESEIKGILAQKMNAIDENFAISSFIIKELKDIHPSIFYDLEKYYPEGLATMNEMRHEYVAEVVASNIERGILEGLYRKDLRVQIVTSLWVIRLNILFESNNTLLQEFSLTEVYEEMFIHHIRGIASEKGLKYFESKQMQSKQTK